MRRKLAPIGVILILALAITAWFTHKPLRARYYVRQLGAATDNADVNYDGLVAVSEHALPRIVELMRRDAVNIDFLNEALTRIVQSMPKGDPCLASTGELLANAYPECGVRSR